MADQRLQEGERPVWKLMARHMPAPDPQHWMAIITGPVVGEDGEMIEVVPREVAERLAEALEENQRLRYSGHAGKVCRQWDAADEVLAEFRAVFPKAEEA